MGAESLLQRGYSPPCASPGYSDSALLTGYIGGLGDSHEIQISAMKERDKYPSFYSIPVLSTDSLGLVQL